MYLVIWIAFFQILFILFSSLPYSVNVVVHGLVGVAILGLAFRVSRELSRSSCPARIRRISKITRNLAVFQGVLGLALGMGYALSWGSVYAGVVSFLHVGNALAIITQASSSATAFDMREEKEFQIAPSLPS